MYKNTFSALDLVFSITLSRRSSKSYCNKLIFSHSYVKLTFSRQYDRVMRLAWELTIVV